MLAVALVVGIVIVLIVVQRVVGKTVNTADRVIRHKTYEGGITEAATKIVFSAPVRPGELLSRIIEVVNAYDSAPAVAPGLYLKQQTGSSAAFAFGSKIQNDYFVAQVQLASNEGGCAGRFAILGWRESGAEVYGRKEMARLRERISQAVKDVGGNTKVS